MQTPALILLQFLRNQALVKKRGKMYSGENYSRIGEQSDIHLISLIYVLPNFPHDSHF